MGTWGHAARVCMVWRVWQNPLYEFLAPQYNAAALGRARTEIVVRWTPAMRAIMAKLRADLEWEEPTKPFRWAHWL